MNPVRPEDVARRIGAAYRRLATAQSNHRRFHTDETLAHLLKMEQELEETMRWAESIDTKPKVKP